MPSLIRRLHRAYALYTLGFVAFVLGLGWAERAGLSHTAIGFAFLAGTVGVYAVIGVRSRTTSVDEYFVAGRSVPAFYNGVAASADWMSAASFIGLAGSLYLSGFGGLAYVIGWMGGFVVVALCLAPYLRRFAGYTVPEFLGARYGSAPVRLVAALLTMLISFAYLVAQIYAVGLITARLTGMSFEIGVFVGLGGVLVCSFLGGMRAVTWTQVAQYVILIAAYLVPLGWLSVQQGGAVLPEFSYGPQVRALTADEQRLAADPLEQDVKRIYRERAAADAARLVDVERSLAQERLEASQAVAELKSADAPLEQVQVAEQRQAALPSTPAEARARWERRLADDTQAGQGLAGMPRHARAFAGDPQGTPAQAQAFGESRRNFLALIFCLMFGTAGLPHILGRYYTTATVGEARRSVGWTLGFVGLLYFAAPAMAVLVKESIIHQLVGMPIHELPGWLAQWSRIDPGLLSVSDVNGDGRLQFGELHLSGDVIMLIAPDLGHMPFVVSAMVAAGGLAAALSTADGLLLTISAALSHDVYFRVFDAHAPMTRRVTLSKALLLGVAVAAAAAATQFSIDIVVLVAAAFSFAAAGMFPPLLLGIFWRRANAWGALAGMVAGSGVTAWYMSFGQQWSWWGIQPLSAGLFGVPAAFAVAILVSLLTPAPRAGEMRMLDALRRP